jgi:hypothetical protein
MKVHLLHFALLTGGLLILGLTATAAEVVTVVPAEAFPDAMQPQVAVGPSGKVFVVFGMRDAIYCAVSKDGGKSYGNPVKVGAAGSLSLGMRRGPRVAATASGVVVTGIGGKQGKGRDGDLLAWRSTDDGQTWQGPVQVNSVNDSAREGLHGMTASKDGSVYCVWLDLRAKKSQVYGAVSRNLGTTWESEKLLYESPDGDVCPCCQPSAAYDPRGGLHVMWRNALKSDRDMYLLSSTDGGKTFGKAIKLGEGAWRLNTCPMDGGGLAGDANGRVTTVWMRKKEVFRCEPGQAEVSLGKGEQAWAGTGPAGVTLVWIETRPGVLKALLPGTDKPIILAKSATDPAVAGLLDGNGPLVVVWEEGKAGNRSIRSMILGTTKE